MQPLSVLLAVLFLAAAHVLGQANLNTIVGTWSSGSGGVVTGAGFADPANLTFTFPKTTGVSYSFTADMFYEIARYRFVANATDPGCITGVLQWVHGNYTLNTNGSISMFPFLDGFQQIQDPCATESIIIDPSYNYTELYRGWQITQDPVKGPQLLLYEADGTPVAPQTLLSASPNMLPTTTLRNKAPPPATTSDGLVTGGGSRRRSYEKRSLLWWW